MGELLNSPFFCDPKYRKNQCTMLLLCSPFYSPEQGYFFLIPTGRSFSILPLLQSDSLIPIIFTGTIPSSDIFFYGIDNMDCSFVKTTHITCSSHQFAVKLVSPQAHHPCMLLFLCGLHLWE
jgi:hypothetical protein